MSERQNVKKKMLMSERFKLSSKRNGQNLIKPSSLTLLKLTKVSQPMAKRFTWFLPLGLSEQDNH